MEGLRRAYGMAEPVRRGMEIKIVKDGSFRPAVLGGTSAGTVHEDILALGGRDTEVGWEDVFIGLFFSSLVVVMLTGCLGDEFREPPSFHDEMEKRLRMEF